MICPLSMIDTTTPPMDCLEGKCGWWHHGQDGCSIPAISGAIQHIEDQYMAHIRRGG